MCLCECVSANNEMTSRAVHQSRVNQYAPGFANLITHSRDIIAPSTPDWLSRSETIQSAETGLPTVSTVPDNIQATSTLANEQARLQLLAAKPTVSQAVSQASSSSEPGVKKPRKPRTVKPKEHSAEDLSRAIAKSVAVYLQNQSKSK